MNEVLQVKLRNYIDEHGKGTQGRIAKAIGYSDTTVSQYLGNKYIGDVQAIENKLTEFFRNIEDAEQLKSKNVGVEYVPTSVSEAVYETIRLCHLKGGFAMEVGDAGIGKTMACKKYCRDYPSSSVYVYANTCFSSVTSFLKLLCRELKITTSGHKDDMWLDIYDALLGERKVLIIDEAQNLPIKTIEALRAFFDSNPRLGICLVGNIETVTNLRQGRQSYAQIRNRTKLTEIRHTKNITENDIKLLFPTLADNKKEIELLLKITQTYQGVRGAVDTYCNALDNENITYEGLLAAAKLQN